jgi:hypothetical protein
MNTKAKYLLHIFIFLAFVDVSAQNSQVSYFMNIPQSHLINPALRPSNSIYIGLPVLSGINVNLNNNFVNFSDVFSKSTSTDSVFSFLESESSVNDFLGKIKNKNSIEPEINLQLFGLGFTAGRSYIFFDINERVEGNIVIPKDIFTLALKGNGSFVGDAIDLSSLRGDIKYYREYGLGFSRNFTNRLRIGVKGKLLFGKATASIHNKALAINVGDDYSHTLDADIALNFSGPVIVTMDSKNKVKDITFDDNRFDNGSGVRDFFLGGKNMGLGFDVGATYDLTNKIQLSAALTDIGFIRWKNDVTNLTGQSKFEFEGLDMLNVFNGTKTFEEVGQDVLDSLKDSFHFVKKTDPFTTFLPFGVSLAGSYDVTKSFSLGVLSYSRFIGKQMRESFTVSANLNLKNAFSTSISYTAENHRYDNLGFGIAFRPGIFQFYTMADMIPVIWNKIKNDESTMMIPASWNTINFRIGMNLSFGNRIKKKDDKPMVVVDNMAEEK